MKNSILAKSLAQSLDHGRAAAEAPSPAAGAPKTVRTMSEVLSSVAAQAAQEIDTAEIADSEVADRFNVQDGIEALVESIRSSGQQLPVLLRHRRGEGPRYEVVYGRRRIAACRILGRKVMAHVREMGLDDALMSQALENSARLERSFIEQAVFAAKLESAGFSGERISEALAIDNTTLSRLRSVIRDVPEELVFRIGAAPGIGRRPWMELRDLIRQAPGRPVAELLALVPETGGAGEKLEQLIRALGTPQPAEGRPAPARKPVAAPRAVAGSLSLRAGAGNLVLRAGRKQDREFLSYLEARIAGLYEEWAEGNIGSSD